jgi:hypothetical protein
MYIVAVQDDRISGVVCTRCFDVDNLAFVSDGRVQGDALSFTLLHDRGDGKPYRETFRGKVVGDHITLTASREGNPGQSLAVTLKRPTPNAAAILAEGRRPEGPEPYMPAGPPEPLTPEKVLGVWRAPMGPTAYLLKRVGDRILGLACDPKCTRPDRRNNFVWVRQHDPEAPKDSVWRGAFEEQP